MGYQCWICGAPIEEILGWCSMACKQVYEHERREDILKMLPWEITVEACNFKDKGYFQLYTVLLEIVQEPDNLIKQHRLIGIIQYCRSKKKEQFLSMLIVLSTSSSSEASTIIKLFSHSIT